MSHLSVKNWAHPCAPASSASGGLCKTRAASGKWWCSFPQRPPFLHERSFWGSARPWCYGSLVLPLSVHLAFPPSSRVCCYVFLEEAYGVKYKISACWNHKPTGFLWFPSAEVLGPSPWSRGQFCGCPPNPHPRAAGALSAEGAQRPPDQTARPSAALLLWRVSSVLLAQLSFSCERNQSKAWSYYSQHFPSPIWGICTFCPRANLPSEAWRGDTWAHAARVGTVPTVLL